jgi:hypothetical protein
MPTVILVNDFASVQEFCIFRAEWIVYAMTRNRKDCSLVGSTQFFLHMYYLFMKLCMALFWVRIKEIKVTVILKVKSVSRVGEKGNQGTYDNTQ